MTVSKSQRDASLKWDKKNMTTIGCRVTKQKAEEFKAACTMLGTVPNAVFLQAIKDTIEKAQGKEEGE